MQGLITRAAADMCMRMQLDKGARLRTHLNWCVYEVRAASMGADRWLTLRTETMIRLHSKSAGGGLPAGCGSCCFVFVHFLDCGTREVHTQLSAAILSTLSEDSTPFGR